MKTVHAEQIRMPPISDLAKELDHALRVAGRENELVVVNVVRRVQMRLRRLNAVAQTGNLLNQNAEQIGPDRPRRKVGDGRLFEHRLQRGAHVLVLVSAWIAARDDRGESREAWKRIEEMQSHVE